MSELIRSLACPLPKLDFQTIQLGHGSGGLLTRKLLDEVIFPALGTDGEHDGAILPAMHGQAVTTTDSFVVNPLFFPGGNIGDLAVNGTVNDLAMCGARPVALSLGLILEEGFPLDQLWEILLSVKAAAEEAGVAIVTGDTKVVDKGKADGLFINTSGWGELLPGAEIHPSRIRTGDHILISGPLGNHGMTIMSSRNRLQFDAELQSDTRALHTLSAHLVEELGASLKFMRDPTRGGVATVLNEAIYRSELGIDLVQERLPVDDVVASACELLGLDPMYVANEGLLVAIVAATETERALGIIRSFAFGSQAAHIGTVVKAHPGQVVSENAMGGRRVVSMLPGEQLPRIC